MVSRKSSTVSILWLPIVSMISKTWIPALEAAPLTCPSAVLREPGLGLVLPHLTHSGHLTRPAPSRGGTGRTGPPIALISWRWRRPCPPGTDIEGWRAHMTSTGWNPWKTTAIAGSRSVGRADSGHIEGGSTSVPEPASVALLGGRAGDARVRRATPKRLK